jgi:predicted transcriptional regulator YdeE
MDYEIREEQVQFHLHGLSGTATNKEYVQMLMQLCTPMWAIVKGNGLANKGKNFWVYERDDQVFAGVELTTSSATFELEEKVVTLQKYAYYKHVGPYDQICRVGCEIRADLDSKGYSSTDELYLEKYGDCCADASKAETELFIALKR